MDQKDRKMESPKRRHLIVSGVVQGVGFRKFIDRKAKELKLCGWVKNLNDGTVEINARGTGKALNELIRQAIQGPERSTVHSVQTENATPDLSLADFAIIV